jgi:thiol-disulfide isomerase/thioredoxin
MNAAAPMLAALAGFARIFPTAVLVIALSRAADEPVKIALASSRVELRPGAIATLRLNFEIAEPWHISSTVAQLGPRGAGPSPTSVEIKPAGLVSIDGALRSSPPKKHFDPNFDLEVLTLEGRAWLDIPLKAVASFAPGTHDAKLIVSFQTCNEETCLPPADVTVPFQIVVPAPADFAADDPRWAEAEKLASAVNSGGPGATRAERDLARDARMQRYAALAWALYEAHPGDPRRWTAFEPIFRGTLYFAQSAKPGYDERPNPANLIINEPARAEWIACTARVEAAAATATDAPASLREFFAGRKVSALVLPYTNTRLPPDWLERLVPPIEELAAKFPEGNGAFVYFSRLVGAVEAQFPAALPALVERMSASPNSRVRDQAAARRRVLLAMTQPLEMKFTALDGRAVDTAAWRGKVVIVDYWASWCVPCIQSIPHLKDVYARYHARGLEMISVSVDNANARVALEKLVAKLEIPWPQFFDGKAHRTDYAVRYGVQPIPHVLLAGPDGMIVAVNPAPEQLETEIKRLLKL